MEGLAKIANVAADWYREDEQYRHLSDLAGGFNQKHKAIKNEVALKQQREKTLGAQVGAVTGGIGGGLIGKQFKHPKLGGFLGTVGGTMGGSKIADMTFEDRHPKLVEKENKAEMQRDFANHRLFRYMDEKDYQPD